MFGDDSDAESLAHVAPPLPDAEPLKPQEITAMEKELLGLYLSDHPLDQYAGALKAHVTHTIDDCRNAGDREEVTIAGVLTNVRPYYTKAKNDLMYFLNLEDKTGTISVTLFPRAAAALTDVPAEGQRHHRQGQDVPPRPHQQGRRGRRGGRLRRPASRSAPTQIAPVATAEALLGAGANVVREARPAFSCLNIRLSETHGGEGCEPCSASWPSTTRQAAAAYCCTSPTARAPAASSPT